MPPIAIGLLVSKRPEGVHQIGSGQTAFHLAGTSERVDHEEAGVVAGEHVADLRIDACTVRADVGDVLLHVGVVGVRRIGRVLGNDEREDVRRRVAGRHHELLDRLARVRVEDRAR